MIYVTVNGQGIMQESNDRAGARLRILARPCPAVPQAESEPQHWAALIWTVLGIAESDLGMPVHKWNMPNREHQDPISKWPCRVGDGGILMLTQLG